MKTYVIDVQRCSIHDGPGIRTTVFLKGCPLSCKWCHNPESQSFQKELSFQEALCVNCGLCEKVCLSKVHSITENKHTLDYRKCIQCGECEKACNSKALTMIGRDLTPQEVFEVVRKDMVFYDQSGGGLTISGGEALSHVNFSLQLLKLCKEQDIPTCMETSGYGSITAVDKILPYVDLFLFDYKVSSEEDAKEYIGGSLECILDSFNYIYEQGKNIILRCPIIPFVNDNKRHFEAIAELAITYPNILSIELLPYHNFGISKGRNIGKDIECYAIPKDEDKLEWLSFFYTRGINKVHLT
ncbi:MAG: cutD 2 [Herbinix sp.]|jgi:pyruvate formate lyase activating enzyme|nr:cutD 2 [Herbinix sp.]